MDRFETPPRLRDDLPEPRPTGNELLVRVHASSVNPGDAKIAAGDLSWIAEYEFPVTLGRDFAGVVEQTGSGATRYRAGDEVFGFVLHANPTVHEGSWAELMTIPEDHFVASKPANLDMAHAAAAPLAAVTAFIAVDELAPVAGETVLVIGATGGVGGFFVQLAASAGARIIAPGLPDDKDYLRSLGVADVIDRDGDLKATVAERYPDGVDAILDLLSNAPQDAVLKAGGRLASPVGGAGRGPGRFNFNVMAKPGPENVRRLAELLDEGALRVHIQRTCCVRRWSGARHRRFWRAHVAGSFSHTRPCASDRGAHDLRRGNDNLYGTAQQRLRACHGWGHARKKH